MPLANWIGLGLLGGTGGEQTSENALLDSDGEPILDSSAQAIEGEE